MNRKHTLDILRSTRRLLSALAVLLTIAIFAPACAVFTSISNALDSTSTALGSASDSLESVSTSVRSLSNSLASSSESFASDDDDEEEATNYRRDIRVLTASYLTDGVSADGVEFRRDLGRVAERHGVSDWESNPSTYEAIGAGLRQAGIDRRQISERFAGTHPKALKLMERGYDAAARS